MKKVTYSGGNATRPTKKKVLNKIMPLRADGGINLSDPNDHRYDNKSLGNEDAPTAPPSPDGEPIEVNDPDRPKVSPESPVDQQNPAPPSPPKVRNYSASVDTTDLITGLISAATAIPGTTKRDNQNHMPMGYNPRPYGDGTSAIGKFGIKFEDGGSIQQWNAAHPDQAINRPIEDYQKGFDTTPLGRSKIDNYGSQAGAGTGQPLTSQDKTNWNSYHSNLARTNPLYGSDALNHNNEVGQQTGASSFVQHEYNHYDKNGKLVGHIDPSVDRMSQDQTNSWLDGNRQPQQPNVGNGMPPASYWDNNPAPTQAPVVKPLGLQSNGFPTREEAIAKYKAKPGYVPVAPQKGGSNMYLKGDASNDYNPNAGHVPVNTPGHAGSDEGCENDLNSWTVDKKNYGQDEEGKHGIHIKPENKGKFTAYKKRTGKTTEEALHSKDAHVRQMANFARNAKKWKHEDGGILDEEYDYPEAANGIKMLGAGSINTQGFNPYSNPMHVSQGPSHDTDYSMNGQQMSGIPIQVGDQRAEIQGGEGVYQTKSGDTAILGAMKIPKTLAQGTPFAGKTIQSVANNIADDEAAYTKRLANPANEILQNFSPKNKFDSLKIGSALAMDSAFKTRSAALTAQKEHLTNIQQMMHEDLSKAGVDYSKANDLYGKNGILFGAGGFSKKTVDEQRQLMKEKDYNEALDEYAKTSGKPRLGKAAKFDDGYDEDRTQYVRNYINKKKQDNAASVIPPQVERPNQDDSRSKTAPEEEPETNDTDISNLYPYAKTYNEPQQSPGNVSRSNNTNTANVKAASAPTPASKNYSSLADYNQPHLSDFLGEINYLTKTPDPVLSQQIHPYLETPYQVSFQDRRNQNQSTFNEVARQLQTTGNAASLAALAGQKYEQDNAVNAEEFRTNQGIYNQITNQNYAILNDAEKTNVGLKDQQYARQSQAKSNTDAQKAQALASISDKLAKNRYENTNIQLAEQRSGYRPVYDNQGHMHMEWQGPDHTFNPYGSMAQNPNAGWSETDKYDPATGKYVPDTRTRKMATDATSRWGNIFKS